MTPDRYTDPPRFEPRHCTTILIIERLLSSYLGVFVFMDPGLATS